MRPHQLLIAITLEATVPSTPDSLTLYGIYQVGNTQGVVVQNVKSKQSAVLIFRSKNLTKIELWY